MEIVENVAAEPHRHANSELRGNRDSGYGIIGRGELKHGFSSRYFFVKGSFSHGRQRPDIRQMAVTFTEIVNKQTHLKKSDSSEIYKQLEQERKGTKPIDLEEVTKAIISSYKEGVRYLQHHPGTTRSARACSADVGVELRTEMTLDKMVQVVIDGIRDAHYADQLIGDTPSKQVGWNWESVSSLITRIVVRTSFVR